MSKLTKPQRLMLSRIAAYDGKREGLLICGRGSAPVSTLRDRGLISVEKYSWAFDRHNYWCVVTPAGMAELLR